MKSKKTKTVIIAGIAVLALIFTLAISLKDSDKKVICLDYSEYTLARPEYPEMADYPNEEDEAAYNKWRESVNAQQRDLRFTSELNEFYGKSIVSFLSETDGENKIISPLNIYMALSMLAEVTDGESREEIMSLINCPDIDTLRQRASDLWNANYRRDGATSLTLANSLWLRNDEKYNIKTIKNLADNYYASAYKGEMGSEEYNQVLRDWLNEQTEGLLEKSVSKEKFEPQTVLALASSICYRAKWGEKFNPENTAIGTFHGNDGDNNIDFMHQTLTDRYFWGDNFSAVSMRMENDGGYMQFILPDKDTDIDTLLSDGELMDFILSDSEWENNKFIKINLAMPKFDVESDFDLTDGLKAMGVNKIFNAAEADFGSIIKADNLFLSRADHSARVAVDEDGVKAAAYTVMAVDSGCALPEEEIDFTLDRPFIFTIKSPNGQPLFAGVINNP